MYILPLATPFFLKLLAHRVASFYLTIFMFSLWICSLIVRDFSENIPLWEEWESCLVPVKRRTNHLKSPHNSLFLWESKTLPLGEKWDALKESIKTNQLVFLFVVNLSVYLSMYLFIYFEIGSYYVALIDLELSRQMRLVLNSESFTDPCLTSTEMKGLHNHTAQKNISNQKIISWCNSLNGKILVT